MSSKFSILFFYSERSEVLIRFNQDFGGRGGGGGGHGGHFWISRSSGSILQRFGFKLLVRASRAAGCSTETRITGKADRAEI